MNKIKLKIKAACIIFLFTQLIIFANSGPDSRSKTFQVSKGGKLIIDVDPGGVDITTWDKNEIYIIARGLDNEDMEGININKTGNTIIIKYDGSNGWSQSVNFIINAPKEFSYEVNSSSGEIGVNGNVKGSLNFITMSGDVRVNDVVGNVDINTYGGEIRTGNLNGKINLNTKGGSIRVENIKTGPVEIETMGGEINIRNVENNLNAKTYGGEIEIGDIGGDADVLTYGGDIKVNNVAGSATLKTYGGDIALKSASGTVDVNTYGGDLNLYNITGNIDAKTAAGDIYVELFPKGNGNSRLETSMGEIVLVLPPSVKADIEAVISLKGYNYDDRDDYQIKSDFKADSYTRSMNKKITAKYKLNGGGENIYLKTMNSDIKIRKAKSTGEK